MRLHAEEKMPDFRLSLAFHGETSVADMVKDTPLTVFWVLRYLGCTLCSYDIQEIGREYQRFEELGAKVVVVLQNQKETIESEMEEEALPMPLACDPECVIYDTLLIPATATKEERLPKTPEGIKKLEEKRQKAKEAGIVHGKDEGRAQQLPAMFIVDSERVVHYAHYARHSVDMPSVEETLELIQELK